MVLTIKIPLKNAEYWKTYLVDNNLFDKSYRFSKDNAFIYFAVIKKFNSARLDSDNVEFIDKDILSVKTIGSLKDNLKNSLTAEEFEFVKTSHDIIGTIAILEIPKNLEPKEELIAETLLKINKKLRTVLRKSESHSGIFRTQKMEYLAGINTKETMYMENSIKIKLDVEKVYFSIRLSNERKRISKLVRSGEDILVMFSGCAPYPLVLSKKTTAKHILGIEINPDGHNYGLENIKLNKIKNVDLICGDVKDVVPKLLIENPSLKFDRIIMPLPKTADEFLDEALSVSKTGTVVHFYDFLPDGEFEDALLKIDAACKKRILNHKILDIVRCGQHSPKFFRICVDFEIL